MSLEMNTAVADGLSCAWQVMQLNAMLAGAGGRPA